VIIRSDNLAVRLGLLGALAFVYFVIFPQDVEGLLAPVGQVLALSSAVSPWLYGVIGVAILSWTVIRVWGGGREAVRDREGPPT
jgi:hypothetical protein